MKKKSTSHSAFLNLRVLIGLFVLLAGVFLALVSFGTFSRVFAQNGVTREQMTVALAQALAITPPACVPGSEMFNDVPASSPFCSYIEELSRRGITGGCAPNLFCPGNPVTRQQMAVFIVRAGTTVSAQIDPNIGFTTITNTAANTINTANITALTDGTLVINGKTDLNNNNGGGDCQLNVLIDGTPVTAGGLAAASFFDVQPDAGLGDQITLAYTIARPVSAGSHTVEQQVTCNVQPYNINGNELVLQFSPGGSATPVAAPAQPSGARDGSDR
jgi:S-layer homology domain